MFIVPISGDIIQTNTSNKLKVISYSNYGSTGPAVYVEGSAKTNDANVVSFKDIVKINDTPVTLTNTKVFKSSGRIKRSFQLPQPEDTITVNQVKYIVKNLKLAQRGDLSKGLIVQAENNDTKQETEISIRDIFKIDRAIGSDVFSQRNFLSLYHDYLGSTPKATE